MENNEVINSKKNKQINNIESLKTFCNISHLCGGCVYLNEDYEKQLKLKTDFLELEFKKNFEKKVKINQTIGMDNPLNYRNKAKLAFGYDENKRPILGLFEEGKHNILVNTKCKIQDKEINRIAKFVFEIIKKYSVKIYNEDQEKGFLRYLIIRKGIKTNEIMVIFVTTDSKMFRRETIIKELLVKFPNIKTIVQNINTKKTNAVLGEKNINLYEKGYIMDYLLDYKFKISPLSFYQVNPVQAENLYEKVIEYADLTKNDIVYDLYCGIGTISLIVAKYCRKVFGFEIVNDAIKDAKENARINGVKNVEFIAGKTEIMLPKIVKNGVEADVIIIDPPRSGLDKKTIDTILVVQPRKIIYVSCNPETLVRDLKLLSVKYEIKEVQPVDMFCYTSHVECCSLLCRREKPKSL